jgi:predicted RNA-binding protein YlqC (UPF0109 family)
MSYPEIQMMNDELRDNVVTYLHITCGMLVDPDDVVKIDYRVGEKTTVFEIRTSNVGALLGKKGRLIDAIRMLVKSAGNRQGVRVVIELMECSSAAESR